MTATAAETALNLTEVRVKVHTVYENPATGLTVTVDFDGNAIVSATEFSPEQLTALGHITAEINKRRTV